MDTKAHDFYCPRCQILLLPEQVDLFKSKGRFRFAHTITKNDSIVEEVHMVIEQP